MLLLDPTRKTPIFHISNDCGGELLIADAPRHAKAKKIGKNKVAVLYCCSYEFIVDNLDAPGRFYVGHDGKNQPLSA